MRLSGRTVLAVGLALLASPICAKAQDLTPGAYWPLPNGLNVVTAMNAFNWGDLAFDPSAPIDEARATINTTAVGFARAIGVAGRSVNVSMVVPVVGGHVEGLYLGQPAEVDRFGLGDPYARVAINLYGAPSMTPKEFASSYRMRTIVGASLGVMFPLGQYSSTKLINIGTNRWAFKPELGLARAFGPWVVEVMASVSVFADNTEFVGGRTRSQKPIVTTQAHLTYRFAGGMWLAADANYYTGGQTTIGGRENLDFQKNSRVGATFSKGFKRRHAIRASVSRGAYTTIGADFTSIAVGYNYAWSR